MDKVGAINQRMDGSTSREAAAAKIIITAVSIPNVANKGIGANAIIANPIALETAEPRRATPVV